MVASMSVKEWCLSQVGKERKFLTLFSIGASLFFAGAGLMIFADNRMTPSLDQELVTLAGLVASILGITAAAIGYITLTLLRLFSRPNS